MALSSTIYKAELQVSDLDRQFYATHSLTVAQHPSETDERLLIRLLVFALNACDGLEFTKGISTDDEPDLWLKNLTGELELWVELGQPSLKRIKKACSRAKSVKIYPFSGHGAEIWWSQIKKDVERFQHLQVIDLSSPAISQLGQCLSRNMTLQATIQDGLVWFGDAQKMAQIMPRTLWAG